MERFDHRATANNRVAAPERPVAARPAEGAPAHAAHYARKKPFYKRKLPIISLAVLVVALLAGGAWYFATTGFSGQINSKYQAVFLTNGQVYFGKMQVVNDSYLKINNVYYIQNKNGTAATTDANNIELVQLSKAVHGPKDEMVINRDQVLFFENLNEDGQAAKLISSDKK